MHVQPTAISRCQDITKGSHVACGMWHVAPSGCPCKRHLEEPDENTQTKRGRKEHKTKAKL